ncbi:MAG: acyl--CoA ligase, partial [Chloroflexota bacterium]|nr:acyl--CoA ligase [Chloroflexota bacterium]
MQPAIWSDERARRYRDLGYWTDASYAGYLRQHATAIPDGVALSDGQQSLTWAQIERWTDAVACSLVRRGLQRDAVLATWLPNWIESYLLRFACEKAGLVWLPISRSARLRELRPMLETARAAAVVIAPPDTRDYWAELQELRPALPSLQWSFVARGKGSPELISLAELATQAPSGSEVQELSARSFGAGEVVMLQPTSGSTGIPKLCQYLLAGCTARGRAQVELFSLASHDVMLASVQGFGPSIPPLLAAPVVGAQVTVTDHSGPRQLLELIEHERVSIVFAVPPIYRELVPLLAERVADVSSVRIWYSTGMAMPADLAETLERLTGALVLSGYGGVDLGCWCAPAPEDPPPVRWLTAGQPRGGTELRLVDEAGRPVAGEGEVWGRGPSSTGGYFGQPEATRLAWTEDGWFRTGDIGRFDAEGNLVLVGRKVEVINR